MSHLFFANDLVLFCKASSEQVKVVRDTMALFCSVSGHKINLDNGHLQPGPPSFRNDSHSS